MGRGGGARGDPAGEYSLAREVAGAGTVGRGSDICAADLPMARTHGILNAVGFCTAGLLGWFVENSTHTAVTDVCSFQTEVEREPVH